MKIHPHADLFPPLEGEEFDALVADIQAHGQHEPIVLLDGLIIDGRNRYRACVSAHVEPRTREMRAHEKKDPIAFVVSANVRRRHLNASQLAMLGARIAPMYAEQAKVGRPSKDSEILPPRGGNKRHANAAEQAAKAVGAKTRSVERAKVVLTKGTPELAAAVNAGKLDVKTAARWSEQTAKAQSELVQSVVDGASSKKAEQNSEHWQPVVREESRRAVGPREDAWEWSEHVVASELDRLLRARWTGWNGSDPHIEVVRTLEKWIAIFNKRKVSK